MNVDRPTSTVSRAAHRCPLRLLADTDPVEHRLLEESEFSALVRALRPRQWIKNVLVAAAAFTAGAFDDPQVILAVVGAFVSFCLCASAVYLVNDIRDIEHDRRHPTKRMRPIALGTLPIPVAWAASAGCATLGLALSFSVDPMLGVTMICYAALQWSYSLWLKNQPVIDLAVVASGFLLRAIAGGVATDLPLSQWFLLVASFGSLFMVAGKRYSETFSVGVEAQTRNSLQYYSESYLRFVWSLAAAVAITAYSLWAFEVGQGAATPWAAFSIAPFVLGLLRYAVDIDRGVAGAPEDIVLGDRVLQVLGVAWLVLVGMNVALA